MALFDIIMPKMGESIEEATITKWFVKLGDKITEDDVLLEIATDKVDSEIPSPVDGVLKKVLFQQDETVPVGTVIGIIDMGGESSNDDSDDSNAANDAIPENQNEPMTKTTENKLDPPKQKYTSDNQKFYSPLVKKIAKEEGIPLHALDEIQGSGSKGRVTKNDVLEFLKIKGTKNQVQSTDTRQKHKTEVKVNVSISEQDERIEMGRMRKLIAAHMIHSKQTSAHVTNMLEVDVTNLVNWRDEHKLKYLEKEGQKLTYMPLFLEATVKALRDFPEINSAVDGDYIIRKKDINLGIAVALEGNNLIVPNIKKAGALNLTGLTSQLNNLASAARSNKLQPDDISGGTFTVTNFGTFKNDIGTPIINQPEVAILAIGAIKKKPAVLETEEGDVIAIRKKMWLSLTYDHRIIDGSLGGNFLRRLGDYIEEFDKKRSV